MKKIQTFSLIFFLLSFSNCAIVWGSDVDHETVEKDATFDKIKVKAKQGFTAYQHQLGYLYLTGTDVSKDFDKARKWLQRAAAKGYREAQYNLGVIYYRGWGVEVDYQRAFNLFLDAANQNSVLAQIALGFIHRSQIIPAKHSFQKAFDWFQKAALQGDAIAQYELAETYSNARGTPQNTEEALKMYHASSNQNFPLAEYRLGRFCETGKFVKQNDDNARIFYLHFLDHVKDKLIEYEEQEVTRKIEHAKDFLHKNFPENKKRKRQEPGNDSSIEDDIEEIPSSNSKKQKLEEKED